MRSLGVRGWLLVARMGGWRLALPLLRRALALERLLRLVSSPRHRLRDPAREELATRIAARLWRGAPGPCLERSLALHRQLGLGGAAPRLAIGAAHADDALVAHAWVLLDGRALLEADDPAAEYRVVALFDEHGARLPVPSPGAGDAAPTAKTR